MEVNQFSEILMGELTVEQYIEILGFIFGLIIVGCAVASLVVDIVKFILDLIKYAVRKDKYNSDFIHRRAYKHIAILRNQFKSARTSTEYMLFYNRLVAAISAYLEIGLIPYEYFMKIMKVSSHYDKKFIEEYTLHARARDNCGANEANPIENKERGADEAGTA